MIIFTKIKWKNFLSTGNAFTEIPLNDTANALIVGENGAGKSTILDALCFALFGKAFRNINKPKLVNSVNDKNCLVELEFSISPNSYKIVRGIKPNIFEIWCDGTLINQDSKTTDYQDYLEKFIIKMTIKSFTQIVILGSASFTPFMQLKPAERRAVIEDLLDIQVFSVMNEIVKQKLQVNKEEIEKNRIFLIGKKEKVSYIQKVIKNLEKNNEQKKTELEESIKFLKEKETALNSRLKIVNDELSEKTEQTLGKTKLQSKYSKLLVLKSQIDTKHKTNINDIHFFEKNHYCPTCKQEIDENFKKGEIDRLTKNLEPLKKGLGDIETTMKETLNLVENIDKLLENIDTLKQNRSNIESDIKACRVKITDHIESIKSLESSDTIQLTNKRELQCALEEIKVAEKDKEKMLKERLMIDTAISLLKDGGIKTKIIKQYLPVINKLINKYLQQMGFFVDFNINESFEETILSRYRDSFSYDNFSEGEKMRIDLSILFTWRAIAKMRNSVNTNLLLFDEIFDGSLDGNGTDEFLKIMWGLTEDTNVFVISHKQDQLVEKFKKTYRFSKKQNFSVVTT